MWKRRMAPAEESRLHNGKQCVRCCPRHRSCRFLISLFLPLLLIRLLIFGSFLASPFIYITYSFWFFLLRIRCISKSAPPCGMTYPSNIDIHPFSIRTNLIYFFSFFQLGRSVVGGEQGRRRVRRSNVDWLITNLKFEHVTRCVK